MFIEILFKMLLFKGDVLIYAEHCMSCNEQDYRSHNISRPGKGMEINKV